MIKRSFLFGLVPLTLVFSLEGSEVVSGSATVHQDGQTTTYNCASDKTIINHESFHVAKGHKVHFQQPGHKSSVLNRVTGNDPSRIMGKLSSNGNLFLINPHGILITKEGQINTNSFVASTLDIADGDFLKGKYRFQMGPGAKESSIRNQGTIIAEQNIALIASKIFNEGTIMVKAGKAALAAGEIVTLDFGGDGLMSIAVEGQLEKAIIAHLGTITASEGEVLIHLETARELLEKTINVDGVEIGSVMQMENGIVRIAANSEIHSPAVSVQGRNVEVAGKMADCDTLQVKAGDTVRFLRDFRSAGSITLAANTIDLRGPLKAASAALSAVFEIKTAGDIVTTKGDLVFSGPVRATLGKAEFSAGGNLVFNGPLSGSADFKLLAENGAVRLQENVGAAKTRVKSLTVAARTIEQRAQVYSAGAVHYSGVVYLGGDISTMNHDIVFNDRVIRDHADTCRLTTSLGNGNVIFRSHLDADNASRNLNVIAGLGTVFFMGAIGDEGPLGNLRVSADSISLSDIGTRERPGAGHIHMQATGSEGQLSLRGKTYHCKHHNWGAKKISLLSQEPIHFMSAEGGVFSSSIAAAFDSPLYFSTYGGHFQFTGIAGAGRNDVFIDACGGGVNLMRCEGVGALQIRDGSVELGDVRAGSITINAGAHSVAFKGAVQASGAIQVDSQGMVFMNSLQAQECSVHSPAGNVILKGALDIAGPFQIDGKEVYVQQGFHAGDVKINAQGSIYSAQLHSFATIERGDVNTGQALTDQETGQTVVQENMRLDSIRSDSDIFLHAKGAHVGRLEAPIVAEADGRLFIGCRESAAIKAPRNRLQLISGSEPRYYYLDGVEYADRFFSSDFSFFQQEEIFSLTQELLTHGRGDYLDPSALQSRRALLFYTQDNKKTAQAD